MPEEIVTEVPGNVWKVLVKPGDTVEAGDVVFILDIMKMEVPHAATVKGVVQSVSIVEGQQGVDAGVVAVVTA